MRHKMDGNTQNSLNETIRMFFFHLIIQGLGNFNSCEYDLITNNAITNRNNQTYRNHKEKCHEKHILNIYVNLIRTICEACAPQIINFTV